MATRAETTIFIIAKDQASKVFGSVAKGARQFASSVEGSAKTLTNVGKAADKLGNRLTVGLTVPIVAAGKASIDAAASANRYRTALANLAGGAEQAEAYIQAIQDASRGTISQLDAMQVATRALTFDVVENADMMRELTSIAVTLGRAQGLTATQSISDMTLALGRQSYMILDNLGITLRMSEAYDIAAAHAAEFGLEADNLTRAQAFQVAALVKGREVAASLGGVMDDQAASFERAQARIKDMAVNLGQQLLPIAEEIAGVVSSVAGAFNSLDDESKQLIIRLALVAAATGPALKGLGGLLQAAPGAAKVVGALAGALPNVGAGLQLLREGASAAEVASLGLAGKLAVAVPVVAALAAAATAVYLAWQHFSEIQETVAATQEKHIGILQESANASLGASQVAQQYADNLARAAEIAKGAPWYLKLFVGETQLVKQAQEAASLSTGELNRLLLEAATSYQDYAAAAAQVVPESEAVTEAEYRVRDGLAQSAQQLIQNARAAFQYLDSALNLTNAQGDLADVTAEVAQQFGKMEFDEQALWGLALGTELTGEQMVELARELGVASTAEMKATQEAYDLVAAFQSGEISAEQLASAFMALGVEIDRLNVAAASPAAQAYTTAMGRLKEASAKVAEAQAAVRTELQDTASTAVNTAKQIADAQARWQRERTNAARRANLSIMIWEREQNEFVADNAADLTDEMAAEFAERTRIAREHAMEVKEYDARLAGDLLDAESDYQQEKARLAADGDEDGLARLERDHAERIADLEATAELERQIEEENREEQIRLMREGGAAAGQAMAESFLEEAEEGLFRAQEAAAEAAQNMKREMEESEPFDDLSEGASDFIDWLKDVEEAAHDVAKAMRDIPPPPEVGAGGQRAGGGPKRQFGGPVWAGQSYLVGERGPEIFNPDRHGTIIPAVTTREIIRDRGGGDTITYHVNLRDSLAAVLFRDQQRMRRIERAEARM